MSIEEPKTPIAIGDWAKARQNADFHLNPDMIPPVDPHHQGILDQIGQADEAELKKIQESMAEAVIRDRSLVNNRNYIEKLQVAYERAQEIKGVGDKQTLH